MGWGRPVQDLDGRLPLCCADVGVWRRQAGAGLLQPLPRVGPGRQRVARPGPPPQPPDADTRHTAREAQEAKSRPHTRPRSRPTHGKETHGPHGQETHGPGRPGGAWTAQPPVARPARGPWPQLPRRLNPPSTHTGGGGGCMRVVWCACSSCGMARTCAASRLLPTVDGPRSAGVSAASRVPSLRLARASGPTSAATPARAGPHPPPDAEPRPARPGLLVALCAGRCRRLERPPRRPCGAPRRANGVEPAPPRPARRGRHRACLKPATSRRQQALGRCKQAKQQPG